MDQPRQRPGLLLQDLQPFGRSEGKHPADEGQIHTIVAVERFMIGGLCRRGPIIMVLMRLQPSRLLSLRCQGSIIPLARICVRFNMAEPG